VAKEFGTTVTGIQTAITLYTLVMAMLVGIVSLFASIDPAAGAEIVTVPLLLAGLGIGALASQLGAVTVSAVPDEDSPEVGGLQNTGTNLGASIGTALAGRS
jgi:predicted MFS family arabinose efflux permease